MTIEHTYSYAATLADSLKIQWNVDDLIGGSKSLDFSRPFLPDTLARTKQLDSLSASEQLILNQVRGATYLHLFGLVEEFILPFAIERAKDGISTDKLRTRALLSFAEEEAKHQQLFERFSSEFAKGFKTPVEFIGPASAIAQHVLSHSQLAIAVLVLHLEWLTQRHYLDSVKTDEALDPQFVSLLKHHWQEEAQHAKLDTLVTAELAAHSTPAEVDAAINEFIEIVRFLDGGLQEQVEFDLNALEHASGRKFGTAERQTLHSAQVSSYRHTFIVSGLEQKNFITTLQQLSPEGASRISALARELA